MKDETLISTLIMFKQGAKVNVERLREHGLQGDVTVLPRLRIVKGMLTEEARKNLPLEDLGILVVKVEEGVEAI